MLIYINLSSSQQNWYVAPLLMFLPLLLSGGLQLLLELPLALLSWLTGSGPAAIPQQSREPLRHPPHVEVQASGADLLGFAIFFVFGAWFVYQLQQRRQGAFSWRGLFNSLFRGIGGGRAPQPGVQQQQRRAARPARRTVADVAAVLQKFPMVTHQTKEELDKLPVHDLKEQLQAQAIDCSGCLEKHDLVAKILEHGGSSCTSCSICCEEYESGDVLRMLPCKHKFHIECIDKWFYSSTDYSRPPACPLCNAEIMKD